MPGFHEHDENDTGFGIDLEDEEHLELTDQGDEKFTPQFSVPTKVTSDVEAVASKSRINTKPQSAQHANVASTSRRSPSPYKPAFQQDSLKSLEDSEQICPVCSKTLATDNQGLNAHVDFCLSRGAIKEARGEATSPMKSRSSSGPPDLETPWKGWGKPKSTAKLKGKHG
jgi:DNA polymerase kappa